MLLFASVLLLRYFQMTMRNLGHELHHHFCVGMFHEAILLAQSYSFPDWPCILCLLLANGHFIASRTGRNCFNSMQHARSSVKHITPSLDLISIVTQSLHLSQHGPLVLILFIFRIHMFLRFWGKNSMVYMYFDTSLHPKRYVQIIFVLTASYRPLS